MVCALLTMKRLSKLTRQQAKHQGIELIIEGSDGGFLISQAAAKIVKLLERSSPTGGLPGNNGMTLAMNGVIHEWVDLAGKSSHGHDSNQGKSFRLCLLSEQS